jgi:hypothetical protein
MITALSTGGIAGRTLLAMVGARVMWPASTACGFGPVKGGAPVSISYAMAPSA